MNWVNGVEDIMLSTICPGSSNGRPNTSSAEVHLIISFTKLRNANRTRGNLSSHGRLSAVAVKDAFNWRRNLLTRPLAQEWYTVLVICLTPNSQVNSENRVDWNCGPWFVVMTEEHPYIKIQWGNMAHATASALVDINGTTTGHLVNRSTIVNKYSYPIICSNEPTWIWRNQPSGVGN